MLLGSSGALWDLVIKQDVHIFILVFLQRRYFQPPSVCVNAAGITQDEFLLKMEEDDFDKVIKINLKVRQSRV